MMRSVLVVLGALSVLACSGGSSLGTDGGTADGGRSGFESDDAGTAADGSGFGCTPGSHVFCRCSDRTEGTKLCAEDGKSFGPCSTDLAPCP
jgi:hypothetical protein